ncbi:MAG: FtsX-like permease family protein [Myxococcota bacterium]|nr:FtsX-like permease family protein [Myxococcota bacterium]
MSLGTLIRRNLFRHQRRTMIVATLLASGVSGLLIFGSFSLGIIENVATPLLPKLPVGLIKIEPKMLGFGMFGFDSQALGGGLDEKAIARLEQTPNVAAVYEIIGAGFPLRAQGGAKLLGRGIRTDIFATGVPEELVAEDIAEGYQFKDPGPNKKVIPVLVSRRLLDLYNTTVSQALGQPKLTKEALIGFSAEIVLGSSYVRGTPDPSKVQTLVGQVVGVSDEATLVGITVPRQTILRWNRTHAAGKSPMVAAYIKPLSAANTAQITHQIEKLGLKVDETQKLISFATLIASLVASGFLLGFALLISLSMAQAFSLMINERRQELATLRALGATKGTLIRMVLTESMVIAVGSSALGMLLGILITFGLDAWLLNALRESSFRPATFIEYSPGLLFGVPTAGVIAALAGALGPALRASQSDPAKQLRQ